jgi:hypothetical protein
MDRQLRNITRADCPRSRSVGCRRSARGRDRPSVCSCSASACPRPSLPAVAVGLGLPAILPASGCHLPAVASVRRLRSRTAAASVRALAGNLARARGQPRSVVGCRRSRTARNRDPSDSRIATDRGLPAVCSASAGARSRTARNRDPSLPAVSVAVGLGLRLRLSVGCDRDPCHVRNRDFDHNTIGQPKSRPLIAGVRYCPDPARVQTGGSLCSSRPMGQGLAAFHSAPPKLAKLATEKGIA